MNKLAKLLRKRMDIEKLSVRSAGELIGVSHSTVARIVNGETVEIDTLVKVTDFLGIPVENVLEVREEANELWEQIVGVISVEPELSDVFARISRMINAGMIDKKVLSEIAAFASYRLQQQAPGVSFEAPISVESSVKETLPRT